ncbi:CopG family transcriptional regulator [Shewanella sp.]|uniref:CopG family transcriptional regulator n=1 Tax=Shewanella sp. TaxID=50422 RepID=UPI0035625F9E
MGLADLKKNSTRSDGQIQQKKTIDEFIDEFIDGANRYAMGLPKHKAAVISLEERRQKPASNGPELPRRKGPFRKATFSLGETAITQLAEMASGCDMAKSKLLRFLIEHHYRLSSTERKQLEQILKTD